MSLVPTGADVRPTGLDIVWGDFRLAGNAESLGLAFEAEGLRVDLQLSPLAVWSDLGPGGAAGRLGVAAYRSCPRLALTGTVDMEPVQGAAWVDHQRGGQDQVFSTEGGRLRLMGWEWFAVNLADGTDLMLFQPRELFSRRIEHPFGAVFEAGGWRPLERRWEGRAVRWLKGSLGGRRFAVDWRIDVPELGMELNVRSTTTAGELPVAGPMSWSWQSPLAVDGWRAGRPVSGSGWLELNGYGYPLGVGGQAGFWGRYLLQRLGL